LCKQRQTKYFLLKHVLKRQLCHVAVLCRACR